MAVKQYEKGKATQVSANFKSTEFDCKCKGTCKTTLIDDNLIKVLQQIRNHFGKPVSINSAYRDASHNKSVGGATGSYHVKGMAADIVVSGTKPVDVAKFAEHIGVKGIGLYDNFVHVDTRTAKSFWYSSKQEYRSTFGGSNPYAEPTVNVKRGSVGNAVRWVQWELNAAGYDCGTVDGVAGDKTVKAITNFQKAHNLVADGICGSKTRAALKSE